MNSPTTSGVYYSLISHEYYNYKEKSVGFSFGTKVCVRKQAIASDINKIGGVHELI